MSSFLDKIGQKVLLGQLKLHDSASCDNNLTSLVQSFTKL